MLNDDKKTLKYICELCDFKCSKKGDYMRHLSTLKHKKRINNDNNDDNNDAKLTSKSEYFNCVCGKIYRYRQGLHTHKKKCNLNWCILYTSFILSMTPSSKSVSINSVNFNLIVILCIISLYTL